MTTCTICRFATELDDVAIGGMSGRGICLRCFTHQTGTARPMSKALRRELTATLAALELAGREA